jgi:predicted DNA-binding transcriptional regulator AlpA
MPGPGNHQNQPNPTLTKRDVIELLGKSKRTIDTYMADGRLPYDYVTGANGKQAAFSREDVERLKRELETPIRATPGSTVARTPGAVVATDSSRIEPYRADPQAIAGTIAAVLREALHAPAPVRPWLTLHEAVAWSGLPASYLVRAAKEGKVKALNVARNGGRAFWRFNRDDLQR